MQTATHKTGYFCNIKVYSSKFTREWMQYPLRCSLKYYVKSKSNLILVLFPTFLQVMRALKGFRNFHVTTLALIKPDPIAQRPNQGLFSPVCHKIVADAPFLSTLMKMELKSNVLIVSHFISPFLHDFLLQKKCYQPHIRIGS